MTNDNFENEKHFLKIIKYERNELFKNNEPMKKNENIKLNYN